MAANQSSSSAISFHTNRYPELTSRAALGLPRRRQVTRDELSSWSRADIRTLWVALREMNTCEHIFKSWIEHFDNVELGRQTRHEIRIRHQINQLHAQAQMALLATEKIVDAYQRFSEIMAERLRRAAELDGRLTQDSRVVDTANFVSEYSAEVSRHVATMCENLRTLVSTLEETHDRKPNFMDRIIMWLENVFVALFQAAAMAARSYMPNGIFVGGALSIGSTISSAAAAITADLDNRGRKSSSRL
ncbi:hypothetical protein BKA93DRAFT_824071 [Sparassis latifolia]